MEMAVLKTHGKIQVENADDRVLAGLSALGVIINTTRVTRRMQKEVSRKGAREKPITHKT
jgi:hypothetical protein